MAGEVVVVGAPLDHVSVIVIGAVPVQVPWVSVTLSPTVGVPAGVTEITGAAVLTRSLAALDGAAKTKHVARVDASAAPAAALRHTKEFRPRERKSIQYTSMKVLLHRLDNQRSRPSAAYAVSPKVEARAHASAHRHR